MMAKTTAEPIRKYSHYDHIAVQRHAADIHAREQHITAVENSMNVRPINGTGQFDRGMISQQAQQLGQLRADLEAVKQLTGDDLCLTYCRDLIDQADTPYAGQITINGEPLARGSYAPSFAPGMNTAR